MTILPCINEKRVTDQVEPTKELLNKMDALHPEVLLQHGIQPIDYHGSLVFRSAIESIRGTFIASSRIGREGMVGDVLDNLARRKAIRDYKHTANSRRFDFEVALQVDVYAAIEVKGGEGNSINISERPLWANEFGIWSHLDGAIVNQPAYGAGAVVNRIINESVKRGKGVDVVFFKDKLCGTSTRPCPKYPGRVDEVGILAAPDVFLFPQRRPVFSPDHPDKHDPEPPVHTLNTLKLPRLILDLFEVAESDRAKHVWEVHVRVEGLEGARRCHHVNIRHQGEVVRESRSRSWRMPEGR